MGKPSDEAPEAITEVRRNALGQLVKGSPSNNPGGFTKDQKAARELLNAALDTDEMRAAFLAGYREQLERGNPLILVDYANRKLGKPAEAVTIDAKVVGSDAARPLTTETLLALAEGLKPKPP